VDAFDVARWQFGITTVYHFLFVPITIGLSALVAGLQTAWVRTGKEEYLRATKFWGKLFLINFAMGVVTGIVQEFQFGMNWSDYSRFVGDVFGAPLAIEGLLAFFLESTFLGLWIFGWDRLPRRVHPACIWLVAIGTQLSAYFILAANSWMQHPVGYRFNPDTGRAELTSIKAVLTNSTTLITYPHTITAAFVTAGAFMLTVAAWHLRRRNQTSVFKPSFRLAPPARTRPRSARRLARPGPRRADRTPRRPRPPRPGSRERPVEAPRGRSRGGVRAGRPRSGAACSGRARTGGPEPRAVRRTVVRRSSRCALRRDLGRAGGERLRHALASSMAAQARPPWTDGRPALNCQGRYSPSVFLPSRHTGETPTRYRSPASGATRTGLAGSPVVSSGTCAKVALSNISITHIDVGSKSRTAGRIRPFTRAAMWSAVASACKNAKNACFTGKSPASPVA
jgi:Cytochrome bd terminal oxidase subunit I